MVELSWQAGVVGETVSGVAVPVGGGGLVGRVAEVAHLAGLAEGLRAGRGGLVWVEGEPGIGKSSVLAAGLAGVAEPRVGVFWGVCDELGQRLPLRVLTRCLGVAEDAPEGPAAVLRLVDWVAREAVRRPMVLVVDDAHWADEASLLVVAELARLVGQLPLLLAAAARPVPRRAEVAAARRAVQGRGGALLQLGPLAPVEVNELVRRVVRGRPGQGLREAAQAAGGNPLYVRELVDAMLRGNRTRSRGGVVDLAAAAPASPVSLAGAISDRLAFLTEGTVEVLRLAAVLGMEFTVPDLATVAGRPPSALVSVVAEALAAGVLAEAGRGLRFRHGLIREGLAGSMPAGLRAALHAQVARTLMQAGAEMERVAEQLLAAVGAGVLGEGWALDWLLRAGPRLVNRAPDVGAELLRAALEAVPGDEPRREELSGLLLAALWLNQQDDEVVELARQIISRGGDPERIGEAAWRMAYATTGRSFSDDTRVAQGIQVGKELLAGGRVSGRWLIRLRALHGSDLNMAGRYEEAEAVEQAVLADPAADSFAAGYALQVLAGLRCRAGDNAGAVAYFDRALDSIGADVETTDLRLMLLIQKAQCLHFLDRVTEARDTIRQAVREAEHAAPPRLVSSRLTAAWLWYDSGDWDDALAELEDLQLLEPDERTLAGCVRMLITMHRDQPDTTLDAAWHPDAAVDHDMFSAQTGTAFGGVYGVRVLAAERDGGPRQVLTELDTVLEQVSKGWSVVRYQMMPTILRAAVTVGDTAAAQAAVADAAAEAERVGTRSTRVAAEHCRGLLAGDGAVLRAAAEEWAAIGRPLLAGQAYEDAAVAHAERHELDAARSALDAGLARYTELGAAYDTRRAKGRVRRYGLRPVRRETTRPATGWAALTPAELQVAELLRAGKSNPDIAAELFLSRHTVESHVSRILGKLGVKSRLEVVSAAHTAAPV